MSAPIVPRTEPSYDEDRTLFEDNDATIRVPSAGRGPAAPDDADATLRIPSPRPVAQPPIEDPDATIRIPSPRMRTVAAPDADATLRMPSPAARVAPAELADADATIRVPSPGGKAARPEDPQATMALPRPAAAARAVKPLVDLQRLVAGISPLVDAAGVLLSLVPRLRSTSAHADPAGLRDELLARVAEFEAAAAAQGVPRPKIGAARYVLCSFLDETIAATPWGAGGAWAEQNLLQAFHDERSGAAKSFELVDRLLADPVPNLDMLELFYVCLALGFEGRWHGVPGGRAQLDALSAKLLSLLRPESAGDAEARTLSLRWVGAAGAGAKRLPGLPLPALLAVLGAVLVGVLMLLHVRLDDAVRPAFRRIAALPQALQPPERPAAAARARLAPALQADVIAGTLAVRDEPLRSVVTLPADGLFEPGGAQVDPRRSAVLVRIAQALRGVSGQVAVVGHGDDAPPGSLRFPSGWHLTHERARAVAAQLVGHGLPADRVHAEGRADAEPLVPNASADARARNRRIEIELRLPRPDG